MITRFKYAKAKYLENRLSEILINCYKNYPELESDIITFVPMTEKKKRERGFNQTETLSVIVGKELNICVKECLIKAKETPAQAGLDRQKRLENLKDSFAINKEIKKEIKGKKILLIDDVFTTGSTAEACAKVLKRAGAGSVFVLTIAKTV